MKGSNFRLFHLNWCPFLDCHKCCIQWVNSIHFSQLQVSRQMVPEMVITFQPFHLNTFYGSGYWRWCISFLVDVFLLLHRSKNLPSNNRLGTSVYELSKYDNLETGILWCCHLVMCQMFCLTSKKTTLCKFLLLICVSCVIPNPIC